METLGTSASRVTDTWPCVRLVQVTSQPPFHPCIRALGHRGLAWLRHDLFAAGKL